MAEDPIKCLRDSLTNKQLLHEPWTSGVINLSDAERTVYYTRKDGTSSVLQLGSCTSEQAADLSAACQPATFGLGQQDVYDEGYRKAGKLDEGKFAWLFNPNRDEFESKLTTGLFPWNSLDKGIRFEMYKLNVYGKDSFFKTHQDTPHGEDMFGSLVFLLPFEHEGGNLLLRHRGQEFDFDGASLLKKASPTSVAYVAFFSDVEHEVARVISGYRVTITFNLYFSSSRGAAITKTPPEHQPEPPFKAALKKYLADEKFKTDHPYLGFGLAHAYPFKSAISRPDELQLKGSDAILIRTLSELQVPFNYYLLYRECWHVGFLKCPFRILSRGIIDGREDPGIGEDVPWKDLTTGVPYFVWEEDPKEFLKELGTLGNWRFSSWLQRWYNNKTKFRNISVDWITEPKEEYVDRSVVMAYGNEPSLEFYYHHLCVMAKIAPGDVRYDVEDSEEEEEEQE